MKNKLVDLLSPQRATRQTKCILKEHKKRAARNGILYNLLAVLAVVFAIGAASTGLAASAGLAALLGSGFGAMGLTTPRLINYVPGMQGVAAGGIGTVNVPCNRRYHSIRILTTIANGTLTDATTIVSLVELVVNGITIRSHNPKYFIDLAKTYRYTPATGEIPIFFTEFWRNETPRAAEATSWDLFGQGSFVIRLTFLTPGGAVGVGIQSILADFDGKRNTRRDSRGNEVAFLAIIKSADIAVNVANGGNDITTLPTSWPVQRIYIDISANAITSVQISGDNSVKVWEATKAENAIMLNANDITATFFEYPVIFDYDDRIDSNLKTSALNVHIVTTGAATLTLHVNQLINGYR